MGHGDRVVGVTFECHEPSAARSLPRVTDTIVPSGATPGEIDAILRAAVDEGRELYHLDRELIQKLDPDLVVSQDLCRVCAIASGDVSEAMQSLGCEAEVVSYDPMTFEGVLDAMAALDRTVRGGSIGESDDESLPKIDALRKRVEAVAASVESFERPKVLLLEWVDPPFGPGHWIPDLIVAAGGEPLLASPGGRSTTLSWEDVAASEAEVIVVAPCGFDEAGAQAQVEMVTTRPDLAHLPAVRNSRCHAIDADAFIVRPGPRLVDGIEKLAGLIHG